MDLHTIALNNLKRRKGKTLFLVIGLLVGITATVALLSITQVMRQDLESKIERFGANIIISPRSDVLPLTYGSVTLPGLKIKESYEITLNEVKRLKNSHLGLDLISPKIIGPATVNGKNIVLVGTDFSIEKKLKSWWRIKGKLPKTDDSVLISSVLAAKLKVSTGGTVSIKNKSFKVSGILNETGTTDDYALFASLNKVQNILGKKGKISLIEASSSSKIPLEKIALQINKRFPHLKASAIKEAILSKKQNVEMFSWFSIVSSAIILFVASLIVFITMMSSVNERVREIGIFRAIGFRKKHVFSIIMMEAAVVSIIGGISGSFLGYLLALLILPRMINEITYFPPNPLMIFIALLTALFVGIFASLLPARRASNLDPSEALRFI